MCMAYRWYSVELNSRRNEAASARLSEKRDRYFLYQSGIVREWREEKRDGDDVYFFRLRGSTYISSSSLVL